jgi:LD-carboxypeptidase C-terminal domain
VAAWSPCSTCAAHRTGRSWTARSCFGNLRGEVEPAEGRQHPYGLREHGRVRAHTGLLFGRPYGYAPEDREQLHGVIVQRTEGYDFPVVADMDFGHTSPMFTLPVGCRAVIDVERERFEIVEPAVR